MQNSFLRRYSIYGYVFFKILRGKLTRGWVNWTTCACLTFDRCVFQFKLSLKWKLFKSSRSTSQTMSSDESRRGVFIIWEGQCYLIQKEKQTKWRPQSSSKITSKTMIPMLITIAFVGDEQSLRKRNKKYISSCQTNEWTFWGTKLNCSNKAIVCCIQKYNFCGKLR